MWTGACPPTTSGTSCRPDASAANDGNHASSDNKTVTKQCDVCHTVIAEVMSGAPVCGSAAGIQFKHPVDIGDVTQVNCSDCRSGGIGP